MLLRRFIILLLLPPALALSDAESNDTARILVTFESGDPAYRSSSFQAPYRARKQYSISPTIRSAAASIARQHALTELDRWPLRSLSIFCYVYEVEKERIDDVIADLIADDRIDSVQRMHRFETQTDSAVAYDDALLPMQYSLELTQILDAHRLTRGAGVRVAVVDSDADDRHEDLQGAINRSTHVSNLDDNRDQIHGTAVASVIGARANNAMGMVGIAPDASLEVAEACWRDRQKGMAVCDTFSLAKALDAMILSPPTVVNMSLAGPDDPLLRRVIQALIERGAIVVAAWPGGDSHALSFPGSMSDVIAVASSGTPADDENRIVFAPGERILVAVPSDDYEFQSGSSLAAAHITGIVALMKAVHPKLASDEVQRRLLRSQAEPDSNELIVNALRAIQ